MARLNSREKIHLFASLADIKHSLYQISLLQEALINTLAEKGLIKKKNILAKAEELDVDIDSTLTSGQRKTAAPS